MSILILIGFLSFSQLAAATDSLTEEEFLTLSEQVQATNLAVEEQFRINIDPDDLAINEDLPSEWWNILLLGTDTGGKLNYGRTDAMLILSIQIETGEMKLTSILRDMWVDIPGMKYPNLINAANSFGGPYLAIKTVNTLLDMNIRNYCSINFSGLEKLVDMVGGVTIDLSKPEASIAGARYKDSGTKLNGEQALAYARIRKLDSNFGRNERQRKLIIHIADKVLNTMNTTQTMSIIAEMLPYVDTNLTLSNIYTLVKLFNVNDEFQVDILSLPPDDTWYYAYTNEKSKVIFEQEPTTTALHEFIYTEE